MVFVKIALSPCLRRARDCRGGRGGAGGGGGPRAGRRLLHCCLFCTRFSPILSLILNILSFYRQSSVHFVKCGIFNFSFFRHWSHYGVKLIDFTPQSDHYQCLSFSMCVSRSNQLTGRQQTACLTSSASSARFQPGAESLPATQEKVITNFNTMPSFSETIKIQIIAI